MNVKRCVTFAGAPGSSKTPIANYLSGMLNLPVLNNDAIRTEVTEDLRAFDSDVYDRRQEDRCKALLATGNSFIFDASVDRKWSTLDSWLQAHGYRCFIISLDLSRELLSALYEAKNYQDTALLPAYIEQHDRFLADYGSRVGLRITDADFNERLPIAHRHVSDWMATGMAGA